MLHYMSVANQEPVTIRETEQSVVEKLEHLHERGIPSLVTSTGEKVKLPATVYEVLRRVVELMADGKTVTLIPPAKADISCAISTGHIMCYRHTSNELCPQQ